MKEIRGDQFGERYLPALDGWRGIAIFLVLLWHLWPLKNGQPPFFVSFGWMGVDLFFVLSGFLITRILLAAKLKRNYFRNFYARRALRIFPLYFCSVTFVYGLWPPIVGHRPQIRLLIYAWLFLTNFWSAHYGAWFPSPDPFTAAHLWSLSIEEQFYLIWPALVLLASRSVLIFTCAVCILISVCGRLAMNKAGAPQIIPYVLTSCRMDGLSFGAGLALVGGVTNYRKFFTFASYLVLSLTSLGLLMIGVKCRSLNENLNPLVQTVGITLAAPLFASMLYLTVSGPKGNLLDRCMRLQVFRCFGRYSYGLYVYHGFLVGWLARAGWAICRPYLGARILGQATYFLLSLGFCFGIALISYHFFEQPLLRLKRFFPEPMSPDLVPE